MAATRDKCWLAKQTENVRISFYYIEDTILANISETIKREVPLLFGEDLKPGAKGTGLDFLLEGERELGKEGYLLEKTKAGYQVKASSAQGLVYGLFGLHRLLLCGGNVSFPYCSKPDQSIRMINHWDNFDGSIERGYAGASIYYDGNVFRGDMDLVAEYARLLASCGLNAVSINNVNVRRLESFFVRGEALQEIKKIVGVFSAYGIKTFLSLNYAAPIIVGGLSTADPCRQEVADWWKNVIAGIYKEIPDFGGFVVKADSEGEPGPFTYGRNHDEGANMLAEAAAPFGGLIIWRCFVYNCAQDWRDRSLDRARAAYDIFMELDGRFADNVILQIKNGPIDFQIREPVSPLFGALKKTNQILEFQITQEYTGHQKDLCFLLPMWKEVMDFETGWGGDVKTLIKEYSPVRTSSGVAAVGSVGMDNNWTGSKLAQANLYGYGRLIWDNALTCEEIAREWVALSFDLKEEEGEVLAQVLLSSRQTYENYTCPLSVGFMCKPSTHYGVDVDGYEYDRWGTYHYADRSGVGRDRTKATGTAYTRQYSDTRFAEYESLDACPDKFLLFFHHVPYTHVLHSGKTVIQHIYDSHFEGVEQVERYQEFWERLKPQLDEESYRNGKERFEQQYANAVNWRDQVNTYFYRKSGIADEKGRKVYG